MPHRHKVTSREIGQVRIYMSQGERRRGGANGLKRLLSGNPPLYKEIIRAARADGLLNATAHHTHYGFSGQGKLQGDDLEIANPELSLCVELIGPRAQLEQFCRRHGDLLVDKVIIYKHMEHWEISAHGLYAGQAPAAEYAEPDTVLADDTE
jgi:PII-like signaling protein